MIKIKLRQKKKEHYTLDFFFNNLLYIIGDLVTRTKVKKDEVNIYGLIEDAKIKLQLK